MATKCICIAHATHLWKKKSADWILWFFELLWSLSDSRFMSILQRKMQEEWSESQTWDRRLVSLIICVDVCLFVCLPLLISLVVRGMVCFLLLICLWLQCHSQAHHRWCWTLLSGDRGSALSTEKTRTGKHRTWGSNYNHLSASHRCGFFIPAEHTQSQSLQLDNNTSL